MCVCVCVCVYVCVCVCVCARQQKLKIFKVSICPRLTWDLSISDLPVSWLQNNLQPIATRYLKSGVACPGQPTPTACSSQSPMVDLNCHTSSLCTRRSMQLKLGLKCTPGTPLFRLLRPKILSVRPTSGEPCFDLTRRWWR